MLSISHSAILLTLTQKSSLNEMAWTGLKTNNITTGLIIRKCSASDFCFPQDCGFQGLARSQTAGENYSQIVMCRVRILDLTTTKYQVTLLYSIFMSALFFGCSTQYMLGPCTMRWVVCCSEPIPQFLNCLNMWKKIEPYFHPGTFSFPDISQDVHVERSLMNGVKCGHYFNQQLIKSARLQEANKKKTLCIAVVYVPKILPHT